MRISKSAPFKFLVVSLFFISFCIQFNKNSIAYQSPLNLGSNSLSVEVPFMPQLDGLIIGDSIRFDNQSIGVISKISESKVAPWILTIDDVDGPLPSSSGIFFYKNKILNNFALFIANLFIILILSLVIRAKRNQSTVVKRV